MEGTAHESGGREDSKITAQLHLQCMSGEEGEGSVTGVCSFYLN